MIWRPHCGATDRRETGGATTIEEPVIIKMNIAHYGAFLALNLKDEKPAIVSRLLAKGREI
jgi:hypothetical protein